MLVPFFPQVVGAVDELAEGAFGKLDRHVIPTPHVAGAGNDRHLHVFNRGDQVGLDPSQTVGEKQVVCVPVGDHRRLRDASLTKVILKISWLVRHALEELLPTYSHELMLFVLVYRRTEFGDLLPFVAFKQSARSKIDQGHWASVSRHVPGDPPVS